MVIRTRQTKQARKLVLPLDLAKDKEQIATEILSVTILDKSTATFTLTFHFADGTELELTEAEVSNGDEFRWEIDRLLLTSSAQAGVTIKLLVGIG